MISIEGLCFKSLWYRNDAGAMTKLEDALILGESLGLVFVYTKTAAIVAVPIDRMGVSNLTNAAEDVVVDVELARQVAGSMWVEPWDSEALASFVASVPPSTPNSATVPDLSTKIVDPNPPPTNTAGIPDVSSVSTDSSTVDDTPTE